MSASLNETLIAEKLFDYSFSNKISFDFLLESNYIVRFVYFYEIAQSLSL